MKITAAQREFRRYTGISADVERRGLGASRIENAWSQRHPAPSQDPPAKDSSAPRAVR